MNTTIAKVLAFELGILIAILAWMALPTLRPNKSDPTRDGQPAADESFANVSPIYRPVPPRSPAVDYLAEDDASASNAAQPMQIVRTDEPQIATESDAGYGDYPPADDPSNYIGTFPEPVLGPDYYYGAPYASYICPQPSQIIVISPTHSFGRRHRAALGYGRHDLTRQNGHPPMRQVPPRWTNRIGPRRPLGPPRLAASPRRTSIAQASQPGRRDRISRNR